MIADTRDVDLSGLERDLDRHYGCPIPWWAELAVIVAGLLAFAGSVLWGGW